MGYKFIGIVFDAPFIEEGGDSSDSYVKLPVMHPSGARYFVEWASGTNTDDCPLVGDAVICESFGGVWKAIGGMSRTAQDAAGGWRAYSRCQKMNEADDEQITLPAAELRLAPDGSVALTLNNVEGDEPKQALAINAMPSGALSIVGNNTDEDEPTEAYSIAAAPDGSLDVATKDAGGNTLGHFSLAADKSVLMENGGGGEMKLDGASGQFSVNGNFTVDV
ncbi:MAG: hypothetical protein MdMp014T_2787 [Treponematales bacterium]